MVQGTSSGAGKTTLAAALCRIFSNAGMQVAPFKAQNMSRYSYNVGGLEIAVAQAMQAVAARCEITPDLNPILLKPLDDHSSKVYLRGKVHRTMSVTEYYKLATTRGLDLALGSLDRLRSRYDLVVIEGAGSPAEINIGERDIANMRIARHAGSPVVLVADIERGGSFASIVGTMSLLEEGDRSLVRGFVFNKFRGDPDMLRSGFEMLEARTGRPVLGILPMLEIALPEEDSMGDRPGGRVWNTALVDAELDTLASVVRKSLNIKAIEGFLA